MIQGKGDIMKAVGTRFYLVIYALLWLAFHAQNSTEIMAVLL